LFCQIEDEYDYIILDCPPALSHISVAALAAARSVIIPVQSEYYSFNAFENFLKLIRTIKMGLNPDLSMEGFLLTMFSSQMRLSRSIESDLREIFSLLIFKTVIPRNVALAEAPAYNVPAILYNAKSTGTQAYIHLAEELINKHASDTLNMEPNQIQSETTL